MMTYTKLFTSILDSTVWQESLQAKVVWVTLMAMADRDGKVEASIPGLAKRAGVSLGECEEALQKFMAPDAYSRTREHDGRRLEAVAGGFVLLNHAKYRAMMSAEDRREYQRVKQGEYRRRRKDRNLEAAREGARQAIAEGLSDHRVAVSQRPSGMDPEEPPILLPGDPPPMTNGSGASAVGISPTPLQPNPLIPPTTKPSTEEDPRHLEEIPLGRSDPELDSQE